MQLTDLQARCIAEAAMHLLIGVIDKKDGIVRPIMDLFGASSSPWIATRCLKTRLIEYSSVNCEFPFLNLSGVYLEPSNCGREMLEKYFKNARYRYCAKEKLTLTEAAHVLGVEKSRASQLLRSIQNISENFRKEVLTCDLNKAWDETRWRKGTTKHLRNCCI